MKWYKGRRNPADILKFYIEKNAEEDTEDRDGGKEEEEEQLELPQQPQSVIELPEL